MSEGIEFKKDGTVEITFDDLRYQLDRPTVRAYRHFETQVEDMRKQAQEISAKIIDLRQQIADLDDLPEVEDAVSERLRDEIREINTPLYKFTTPILTDMFEKLAKRPLPEDPDDWPAWLGTNPAIVTQIMDHWRTVPKVSGVPSPN